MHTKFAFQVQERKNKGTSYNRKIRRETTYIPAVIYAKDYNKLIEIEHDKILRASKNKEFYASVIDLNIDNKVETVLVKDIQKHPYKPKVMHVDFMLVSKNKYITVTVPIKFLNQQSALGIKSGGALIRYMDEITIKCKLENLPKLIEVDLSNLNIGQMIRLKDIQLSEGVSIITKMEQESAVATIRLTRKEAAVAASKTE